MSPSHCFFVCFVLYLIASNNLDLSHTSEELFMFTDGETKAGEKAAAYIHVGRRHAQMNIFQNSGRTASSGTFTYNPCFDH